MFLNNAEQCPSVPIAYFVGATVFHPPIFTVMAKKFLLSYFSSTGRNLRNTDKEFPFDTNVTGGREERRVNKPQQRIVEKFRQIELIN